MPVELLANLNGGQDKLGDGLFFDFLPKSPPLIRFLKNFVVPF
jgi:hypothetical protein